MSTKVRYIITDPSNIRTAIFEQVMEGVKSKFPIESKRYIAELTNIYYKHNPVSYAKQREVIMSKGNISEGIFVDVTLYDKNTHKKLGEVKDHRLMNLPYYTNRFTFIVDGNEYAVVNQLRTKSGVYTRKKGNDEIEAVFNLEKGANFKLVMDPKTGVFRVHFNLGGTKTMFSMMALLKIMHADFGEVERTLGTELFTVNKGSMSDSQYTRVINNLYSKLIAFRNKETDEYVSLLHTDEKVSKLQEYFAGTKLDKDTTAITLGHSFSSVNWRTVLAAAKRILAVYNEEGDIDERDSLEFQKVFSVEDILKERIMKDNTITMKIKQKLDNIAITGDKKIDDSNIKAALTPSTWTKSVRSFLTTSSISRLPAQINPMEMLDTAATVTRLGEGAIENDRAAPDDARMIQLSYSGIIDPFATPESFKVGLDSRFAIGALKGDDNEMYKEVINVKTGKKEAIRVIELYNRKVGFPDAGYIKEKKPNDIIPTMYKGKVIKIPRKDLDYQISSTDIMHTATVSSIPLMNAVQGNRTLMGAKHVQQALPLVEGDKRLVYSKNNSVINKQGEKIDSMEKVLGNYLVPISPCDGVITKIDGEFIYIKNKDTNSTEKVEYTKHFPLATKTMLTNYLKVKVGDEVKKGQILGDSNFNKDGEATLGKNLNIAYMPYFGLNHEDGIVISESCAKKMTHTHTEKITVELDENVILDKSKFTSIFPTVFTKEQLDKLDSRGVIKEGSTVEFGDPLITILYNNIDSKLNQVLGNLHKSLSQPYKDTSEVFEYHNTGQVLEVYSGPRIVTVVVSVDKPAVVGDKLSGSYGNKGVIVKILPDNEMIQNSNGEPMDAVFTSAGVIGRINPAQIQETILGKIAKKQGIRYDIGNFSKENYTKFVRDELKKYNMSDKETVVDPTTGKKIPGILVGTQYIYKLFKTTDSNFAGRGVEGAHDTDETPVGSGELGPKALGGMEVNGLIAQNARSLLRESTMLRGQKNSTFWREYQLGATPSMPTEKNTFTRFTNILRQAGVKVERDGDQFVAGPLTDKDVMEMSSGEIKNALRLNAKLAPEKGGLFDENITGGLDGDRWSHVELAEPVINPMFMDPVKILLNKSTADMKSFYIEEGGDAVKKALNDLDIDKELTLTAKQLEEAKPKDVDPLVKRRKYLQALKDKNLKAGDAYMLSKIPVLPPKFRPISFKADGDLMESDANVFYRELILQNDTFKDLKDVGLPDGIKEGRQALFDRVAELTGVIAPKNQFIQSRGYKGALDYIAGSVPKQGYFQRKVIYNRMNLTGRATIAPDVTLGLDEVGLPEEMAWNLYKPFIIRGLTTSGYGAIQAKQEFEDRSEVAKTLLLDEMEKRPVIINRAPTLWRYSIIAAKPKLRPGKTMLVNTLWEAGTNADFDGDAMTVHLPVTDEAIKDAENMLPSKLVFSDKRKGDLLYAPKTEPNMGLYKATKNVGAPAPKNAKVFRFSNVGEAWQAYHKGELKATDYVEIG